MLTLYNESIHLDTGLMNVKLGCIFESALIRTMLLSHRNQSIIVILDQ